MNSYDSSRDTGWSGYVGELLRGQQPINQLIPAHPYIDTLPQMEKVLERNSPCLNEVLKPPFRSRPFFFMDY